MNNKLTLKNIFFSLVILSGTPLFVHATPIIKSSFDQNTRPLAAFEAQPFFAEVGETMMAMSFLDLIITSIPEYEYDPIILLPAILLSKAKSDANSIIGPTEDGSISPNANELLNSQFVEPTPEPTAVFILGIGLVGLYLFKTWNAKKNRSLEDH